MLKILRIIHDSQPFYISMDVTQADHPLHWLNFVKFLAFIKKNTVSSDKNDTLKISKLANMAPISTGSIELCLDNYLKIHPQKKHGTWKWTLGKGDS